MQDILQEIIVHKRQEVAEQQGKVSLSELQQKVYALQKEERGCRQYSMKAALANSSTGIIAEFKRRSPSKGWINEKADVASITQSYVHAGASALSVLTDSSFFGGCLEDIIQIRQSVEIPILRKDFIVDEYQLFEARAVGANAILLIASVLTVEECKRLAEKAHELQLEVLLEIHHEGELNHINSSIDMLGVNNRNLGTFVTSISNSIQLIDKLPKELLLISESGISEPETIKQLRGLGFRGFLIGETFMKTEKAGETLQGFIHEINRITENKRL